MQAREYPPAVIARFWTKVHAPKLTACWEWTASRRNGYGQFGVSADAIVPAHRFAYEYLVGPIPEGLVIDHLCRNPACVNPRHLEPVSSGENVLRGESPQACNARKTHCKHGHEFTPENTYVDRGSRRHCKVCRARRTREFNARLGSELGSECP